MSFKIYYDSIQEGHWFKKLHPKLDSAELHPFPSKGKGDIRLAKVLAYDRPDIVLGRVNTKAQCVYNQRK